MSLAWHCDAAGCDSWTRAGHKHGFLTVDDGEGLLHFCSWDCNLKYSSKFEPVTKVEVE